MDQAAWRALEDNNVAILENLLNADNVNSCGRNEYGRTLLMEATRTQSVTVVAFLVQCRANLGERDAFGGTALHLASIGGFVTCADVLLNARAHVDSLDNGKWTPLARAIQSNHRELILSLLRFRADMVHVHEVDAANGRGFEYAHELDQRRRRCRAATLCAIWCLRQALVRPLTALIGQYVFNTRFDEEWE